MELKELMQHAQEMYPWLVEVRRDFHQHPELGMEEYRTKAQIINYLEELEIPYIDEIAHTAVVGLIEGTADGANRTVALRGDIDALPILEMNEVPYRSKNEGKMHACGHDAHTTIVLGAAKFLQAHRHLFSGTVKLFFQPAEETVGGADPMIQAGVMDNPKVDAVFGLHVDTHFQVGEIGVRYGQMNASSDTIELTIIGKNAHGAYPSEGVDAIVIAAQVISAIQAIVSRNIDARDSAVITLGTIEGGTQSNIIAEEVKITGTVRALDPAIRAYVLQRIGKVVAAVTESFEATYRYDIGDDGYPALVNTDEMVDIAKASGEALLGSENVTVMDLPTMGAEDFAYFAQAAPSAFFRLGTGNKAKGIIHGAHTPQFNIDEDALVIGVALQVQNVLHFLNGQQLQEQQEMKNFVQV